VIPEAWNVSPQQTDPLSWFSRPLIPLILAAMLAGYGALVVIATYGLTPEPWIDIVAVVLMVVACLVVQHQTRPLRATFTPAQAIVPDLLAIAGLALATMSARESGVFVQHWWAPIGVGFVIATLTPFSTVLHTLLRGAVFSAVAGVGAAIAFLDDVHAWPSASVVWIAVSAVVTATIAAATFAWVIVTSTQRIVAGAGTVRDTTESLTEEAARQVERRTLARLGTRVAPFLETIADAGVITDEDRALAGQLARRLRSDLVNQANRSWLDALALSGPIYVVDPDDRADQMNPVQRTALRGLLREIMQDPVTRTGSLFIELRGQADGSTAVALSVNVDLPEGPRAMMIAPYYLSMQGATDDLRWDESHELMRFRLPAPPTARHGQPG